MMDESKIDSLVARAADGDKGAVEELVREIQDDVYRMALRVIGPGDAEDAAQEILVKVVTHLATFRRDSAFRTWVFRIAANHLLNMRRGKMEIFSFEMMEAMNAQMLANQADLPTGADERILSEEIRLA